MKTTWEIVHDERAALARDLNNLADAEWNSASLCEGWTIHDVLAHLVDDAKTTRFGFFRDLVRAGFNFERLNERGVERERRQHPQETLDAFRADMNRTTSAPAPLATRLIEVIVHGEDIRNPLGIRHEYPVDAVVAALTSMVNTSASMGGGKERVQGYRLVATDSTFEHGTGTELRGTALTLLMMASGRSDWKEIG